MKKILIFLFFLILIFPRLVSARIGVGVGTGIIQVDDKLRSGMSYELPSLTVLNTGDEPSDYFVSLAYHQDQPQLIPPQEWFSFSPDEFYLEPGEVQTVKIRLNLPLKTPIGDYFAYLEGQPSKKSKSGGTSIGIAAVAKLYFTVAPTNFIAGIYYKFWTLWKIYHPWTTAFLIIVVCITLILLFRKFFNFELNVKKKLDIDKEPSKKIDKKLSEEPSKKTDKKPSKKPDKDE